MMLPNGYTQLEYIYASGTQYINTGYVATSKTTAKYKVWLAEVMYVGPHLLSGEKFFFPLFRSYTSGKLFASRGGNDFTNATVFGAGEDYEVDAFTDDKIIVNGTQYGTLACGSTTTDTKPLHLMTYAGSVGNKLYAFKGKLYYCQIYEDGALARDFVPAMRNEDNVVGLYDLANGVFYTNDGTGAFMSNKPTVDTKVPKDYTRVAYIEGGATQYINTNVFATANTRVKAEIEILDFTKTANVYASWKTSANFSFRCTSRKWYVDYGNRTTSTPVQAKNGKFTVDNSASGIAATHEDGTIYAASVNSGSSSASFSGTNQFPLYLFAVNNGGVPRLDADFRMYGMEIYNEGVLERWFIPVKRKSDGEVGLYDAVSQTFFANAGTGAFTTGEEVEDEAALFGTAVLDGVALPISAGMVMLDGVVLPITGGMTKINGVITPITM